jgi:dihydroorotate dehydrogenase
MYSLLFALLKRFDPEVTHHWGMAVVRLAGLPFVRQFLRKRTAPDALLSTKALGFTLGSPVGLAAGFDKNAVAVRGFYALGFDHVEVGTVTAVPQPGNPKPRLFRLPADSALINRMGFNNDGAEVVATRLAALRHWGGNLPIIGVNIGKSRVTDLAEATADYVASATLLAPHADYLVVNVSSPNTPGLRGLQEVGTLKPLLKAVAAASGDTPLLVKISPDIDDKAVGDIAAVVMDLKLAGIIATNTTTSREGLVTRQDSVATMGEGGLSGTPLKEASLRILTLLRQTLPREKAVISVGGISTGADVKDRLDAGATLVQAYTGFVYRGPLFAAHLTRELAGSVSGAPHRV